MKRPISSRLLVLTVLTQISACQFVLPHLFRQALFPSTSLTTPPRLRPQENIQAPMMPILPFGDKENPPSSSNSHKPTLYDTLPLTRRINIFSSLVRDHPDHPTLLSSSSQTHDHQRTNFTVLAPLNSAMQSLPHKPWEDGNDYAAFGERAYDGEGGQERAKGNLKRFVERHIVPKSPWDKGEKARTLAGKETWWEENDENKKVLMPWGVEVEEVVSNAGNGEVWVLKGVLDS